MAKAKPKAKAKVKAKVQPKAKMQPKAKTKAKPKALKKATPAKAKKTKEKVKKMETKAVKKPVASKATKAVAKKTTTVPSLGPVGFKAYKLGKDEEYMNDGQLSHFRNILLLWKQQLLEEFNRTKQHMQNDAANYPDPLDRAAQEEEFNFELRARDRERKLVKKIEDALDSIEKRDYGYCIDCGAEIGIRRLEARPTATQCIDCKTVEEIREKQIAG